MGGRRGTAVAMGMAMLLGTACGNRLPHDAIVAAATPAAVPGTAAGAGGVAAAPAAEIRTGGDGTGPGPGPGGSPVAAGVGGEAGGPAGAPGATGPGGPHPGAGATSAPAGGSKPGAATGTTRPASGPSPAGTSATPGGGPAPGPAQPKTPATPTGAPVTLGHVGTYSGVLGAVFRGGREMAQVWARSVNARGGLAGHPVRMVVADDGADPARNASIVKDMVEHQGVIAFVGNIVPLSISGSVRYLEEKGIPAVGGDGAIVTWWESPVLFPQETFIDTVIGYSARAAVEAGFPKVSLLYCAEAAACTNARRAIVDAAPRAGATIVHQAQISLAQPDFTAECLSARNAGAGAMIIVAEGNTLSRVARSCVQQGFRPQYVSFGLALVNELENDPNLDGTLGITSTFPWMGSTPAVQEYRDAIATFAPAVPKSGATATVWGAGKLMEAAARHAGPNLTSASIMEGLWALRDETLGGLTPPLNFPRGKPASRPVCNWVIKLAGGRWTAPDDMRLRCPPP